MVSIFLRSSTAVLFGILVVNWTTQPTPSPHAGPSQGGDELFSVSAVSPSDAFAVGVGGEFGIFEHWNGQKWALQTSPVTNGACAFYRVTLDRVVALSATDAWAVGSCVGPIIIEHWNGVSWSISPAPTCPAGPVTGQLYDIAAISPADLWAVGTCGSALSLHWNGSTWNVIPTPRLGADTSLTAVAARASNDVWAMGNVYISNHGNPIIEDIVLHWNGTAWLRAAGAPQSTAMFVRRIVTLSATDAWAVGEFDEATVQSHHPLVEHWNGSSWNIVPTPDVGATALLSDVAAVSPENIWAVGAIKRTGSLHEKTLALHWDGTKWSVVSTPSPDQDAALDGVSALSDGSVWGVGRHVPPTTGTGRTLALFTRG